jgi:pyrophosphatase PpaX
MKKIDTILFDLDGTLIDTNEVIIASFKATFKRHFPDLVLSKEKIGTFIGPTLQQTFGEYTDDINLVNEMIKSYREFYVVIEVGNFEIYPNVKETLIKLDKLGYNLAIVTSKFKEAAWPSFTFYGLENIIKVFIALDHVDKPKPDKEPVLKALAHFPNHKEAIMIGDNQGDILSGQNAGIYSAGVSWSFKGPDHLKEVNPDFMLENIEDIFRVIKEIDEE